MIFWQRLSIAFRLPPSIDHQMIYRVAMSELHFRVSKEVSLPLNYSFLRTFLTALLRLKDEAVALV